MRYELTRVESPFGAVVLATTDVGVHALEFVSSDRPADWRFPRKLHRPELAWTADGGDVARRLTAYFDGDLGAVDAIRVAAAGTQFQQRVWAELRRIRPGDVTTYGVLAAAVGRPGAARAVGRANALNPVAIVVPCHRVVGADGSLTGYAFGLDRKERLLRHEGATASGMPSRSRWFSCAHRGSAGRTDEEETDRNGSDGRRRRGVPRGRLPLHVRAPRSDG